MTTQIQIFNVTHNSYVFDSNLLKLNSGLLNSNHYATIQDQFLNITESPRVNFTEDPLPFNPDDECKSYLFVIYIILLPPIIFIGLAGNTLSLIVLGYDARKSVATLILQVLALVDNLFLLSVGITQTFAALSLFYEELSAYHVQPYMQIFLWPLVHITQFWTIYITILIAVNRYIAICKPYEAHKLCKKSLVRIQIGIVILFAIVYNVPRFLEYEIEKVMENNITEISAIPTSMKKNELYRLLYESLAYGIFVFFAPLLTIIILNYCLIKELIAVRRRLITQNTGSEEESNITNVMVIIILIFIFCQTPALINQILGFVLTDSGYKCGNAYYYYYHISNMLVSANSSTNFFVYCAFRKQFRNRVKNICFKKTKINNRTHYDRRTAFHEGESKSLYTEVTELPLAYSRTQ